MKNLVLKSAFALAMVGLAGTAQAAKYTEIEVTDGGSIVGSVSAGDAAPESKSYTISKDTGICGTGTREVNFVTVNDQGMLMDSVVFLSKVKEGKPMPAELATLTMEQKNCRFEPFLGVMSNLGEFTAVNDDATLHNIHTYEQIGNARRTVMNVSQPNAGDVVTKEIKLRKGDGMKVECDAHDFMHAFVFVAKNPYFSVVDENGHFEITDVPPGEYDIMVWHGQLGEVKGGKVTVTANGETTVDLSY